MSFYKLILINAFVFIGCMLTSCSENAEEAHSRLPLSLKDSLKAKFDIQDSIQVIEFYDYPDSLELAVFINYNGNSKFHKALEDYQFSSSDFDYYKHLGVNLDNSTGFEFPNEYSELKGWYKPLGRRDGQTMYANTCDYEFQFEINDTSILFPGMEDAAVYEIHDVSKNGNVVTINTVYKLDSTKNSFKFYYTEFHHAFMFEKSNKGEIECHLVTKKKFLKLFPMVVYICDGIQLEFVLDKLNLDSVKVDVGELEYYGIQKGCRVEAIPRKELWYPFKNAHTVKVFSFNDKSAMSMHKPRKSELFINNQLQRKNIQDSITLNEEQIKDLNASFLELKVTCPEGFESVGNNSNLFVEPDCVYYPHHIFVMYNKEGSVQDYIEVCFMCDMWNTSVGKPVADMCGLQYKLQKYGVKYGLFPYPCED